MMETSYCFKAISFDGDILLVFDDATHAQTVYSVLRRNVEESELPFIGFRNNPTYHLRLFQEKGKQQWNKYVSKFVWDAGADEKNGHKYFFKLEKGAMIPRTSNTERSE
jgi:hypothetical protein